MQLVHVTLSVSFASQLCWIIISTSPFSTSRLIYIKWTLLSWFDLEPVMQLSLWHGQKKTWILNPHNTQMSSLIYVFAQSALEQNIAPRFWTRFDPGPCSSTWERQKGESINDSIISDCLLCFLLLSHSWTHRPVNTQPLTNPFPGFLREKKI